MIGDSRARDDFESYYAEKLWQMIPEVYRHEDGSRVSRHTLRQIVEVIAAQAAQTRRSIDRLWEDQHIETCDDWAVPYIGDLVGTRLVSALDRRARRVDVANTIRFRRRRGTPDLLDSLVRGMSGWDVVLVEGFRRLARTRHRLDPAPRPRGMFTGTPPGGTADLRSPAGAEVAEGPFDEYYHTLDARLLKGRDGRFGIRKLNFHLYRLKAFEMEGVDPVELADPDGLGLLRTYTVDPSGRDVPLFISALPPENDALAGGADPPAATREHPQGAALLEWQVTQAMRCRLLGHTAYEVTASHVAALGELANPPLAADTAALLRVLGLRFDSAAALRRRLQDVGAAIAAVPPDWFRALLGLSLVEATGKRQLYPDQVQLAFDGEAVPREDIVAGDLSNRDCHPEPAGNLARALISPETGRFASVPPDQPPGLAAQVLRYHYGFSADIGAGPYPRGGAATTTGTAADGVVPDGGALQGDGLTIIDNRSYDLAIRADLPLGDAVLQAASGRRPFVRLSGGAGNPFGGTIRPDGTGRTLTIDGGWYAGSDVDGITPAGQPVDLVIANAAPADPAAFDFARVEIGHATLDPGGVRGDGIRLAPLRLLVRCQIDRLIIRRCITGPIIVARDNPDDLARVDELIVCQSIVDAGNVDGGLAVSNLFGTVALEQVTVLGDVEAARLDASDSLVTGRVRVVDNQAGCFRFSASSPGDDVRLPPRFRDVHLTISPAFFNSTRFGDPHYAQLSLVAPEAITRGAETGSEMGAFSHLLTPIRLASVRAKVDEFGPVGVLSQYLFDGDPRAFAFVRFGQIAPEPPIPPTVPPPDLGAILPPPPPPPPPVLPTTCGDEDDEDNGSSGGVSPGAGQVFVDALVLDVGSANLNGAPAFWRDGHWTLDARSPDRTPITPARSIPFDKVDFLIEYDARFGTRPEEQGWEPNSERAAEAFVLDDRGCLSFAFSSNDPILLQGERSFSTARPQQIHAYAVVNLATLETEGDDDGAAFEIQVTAAARRGRPAGLRAGWVRSRGDPRFAYLSLDGSRRQRLSETQPFDRLLNAWHCLSLQADFRTGRTLTSLDGAVDTLPLGFFGQLDTQAGGLIAVRFGSTASRGIVAGQVRNVVLSGPRPFIRAWFRAVAPQNDPRLRLGFVVAGVQDDGTARFLVRYAALPEGSSPFVVPDARAAETLAVQPRRRGELQELDFILDGLRDGQVVWLTVERDHTHADDTLREAVHLVQARFVSERRRRL